MPAIPRLPIRFALAASLTTVFALTACGAGDVTAVARTDAQTPSGGNTATPTPPATVAPQAGKWRAARAGELIDVTLGDLHPTQGAIGCDQIDYKLRRYELQPDKKFDDFRADEGFGGVASSSYTAQSTLREPASYTCTTTDANARDRTLLNAVWNASTRMVATTDPVIDGKTGADLGRADAINGGKKYSKGEFDKLRQPITADKPGKIAYALDYKTHHALPQQA
ncbi:hypothetical protein PI86_13350 [Burkholderia sp. A9]|uniref:ParB-like protein n=1 Tax=Burkholderia sp. A9 TaxID=1365108 RepID=UPI000573D1D4|nr:ParB-like protein [Burkholderia sp. A9]KHK55186.1 hypothetical protein PI86_13350 [Burkholderia sp. A9]